MLSKGERDWIRGEKEVSKSMRKYMVHKIRKKLLQVSDDLQLLADNPELVRLFTNELGEVAKGCYSPIIAAIGSEPRQEQGKTLKLQGLNNYGDSHVPRCQRGGDKEG